MDCSSATLNYSDFNFTGEPQLIKTLDSVDYVKIVLIVLVVIGTVVGNISVIAVIAFNKSMRTTINIYVANLALADLLVCAICMTQFLFKTLLTNHVYILGHVMCKTIHFSKMTFLISSVLTLSAIACDRFIAILFPLRSRITKQRPSLVIIAIWLVSITVSIPLLFIRKLYTVIFMNFTYQSCGDDWPSTYDEETQKCVMSKWMPPFYYTFLTVILFFLPAAIMTVTYSLILWRLSSEIPGEVHEANLNVQRQSRKKVIKMVFTVLLVFVFCWMPLQIVLLYDKHRPEKGALPQWYEEVARAAEFLAYTNSFLNPIIYGGYNKSFRDKLCLLLQCKKRTRRFGTSQIFQRFRLSLSSALTLSTKSTGISRHRQSADAGKTNEIPIRINETVPHGGAEENVPALETHQEVNDTPL